MIREFKRTLETSPLTKKFYGWLYTVKHRKETEAAKEQLRSRGVETVAQIQSILTAYGHPFFFDMGTLLGIVREGKLLGHDMDIDVAVYDAEADDLRDFLLKNGCEHRYRYRSDAFGVMEDSYRLNGIKFDINYYVHDGQRDVCYLAYRDEAEQYASLTEMSVLALSCRPIHALILQPFFDTAVSIPKDAEQYLAERYGDDWRIPNKNWKYWKGPSVTKTGKRGTKEIIPTTEEQK
ncbi:MAG: hypothetical protein IKI29_03705 [Clostridia bacterium]|nr:hypothetical protein [Clostridia bacterium]